MEQEEKLSLDFGNGEIYEVWLEVATIRLIKTSKFVCLRKKRKRYGNFLN